MPREIKPVAVLEDDDLMPTGKYKNKKMVDVPASYLIYIFDKEMVSNIRVKNYIIDNLDVLRQQAKTE